MSGARRSMFKVPPIMSQSDVDAWLKKQVRVDAEAHGWLSPCARKPGKRASVFYRFDDVERVANRIAEGEYPGVAREASMVR